MKNILVFGLAIALSGFLKPIHGIGQLESTYDLSWVHDFESSTNEESVRQFAESIEPATDSTISDWLNVAGFQWRDELVCRGSFTSQMGKLYNKTGVLPSLREIKNFDEWDFEFNGAFAKDNHLFAITSSATKDTIRRFPENGGRLSVRYYKSNSVSFLIDEDPRPRHSHTMIVEYFDGEKIEFPGPNVSGGNVCPFWVIGGYGVSGVLPESSDNQALEILYRKMDAAAEDEMVVRSLRFNSNTLSDEMEKIRYVFNIGSKYPILENYFSQRPHLLGEKPNSKTEFFYIFACNEEFVELSPGILFPKTLYLAMGPDFDENEEPCFTIHKWHSHDVGETRPTAADFTFKVGPNTTVYGIKPTVEELPEVWDLKSVDESLLASSNEKRKSGPVRKKKSNSLNEPASSDQQLILSNKSSGTTWVVGGILFLFGAVLIATGVRRFKVI